MRKKAIKTFFKLLLATVLCGLCFFSFSAIYENNKIDKEIAQFIKDAIDKPFYSEKYNTYFYKVTKDYKDVSPSFTYIDNNDRPLYLRNLPYAPGSSGDILTSLYSPLNSKILRNFVEFYFGGHAAIVDGYDLIETTGLAENMEDNVVIESYNDWLLPENTKRSEFIGIKVKDASYEDRKQAYQNAKAKLGEPYNYTFVFNTKKSHYCTDLVSKSYYQVSKEYDLNQDLIAVTVQDLITSTDTYIFMYKKQNNDGSYNVYYLDDGIEYNFNI